MILQNCSNYGTDSFQIACSTPLSVTNDASFRGFLNSLLIVRADDISHIVCPPPIKYSSPTGPMSYLNRVFMRIELSLSDLLHAKLQSLRLHTVTQIASILVIISVPRAMTRLILHLSATSIFRPSRAESPHAIWRCSLFPAILRAFRRQK